MKKTIVLINFVIFQIVFRAHRMQFWKPCLKLFYQKSKRCLLQIGKKSNFWKKSLQKFTFDRLNTALTTMPKHTG